MAAEWRTLRLKLLLPLLTVITVLVLIHAVETHRQFNLALMTRHEQLAQLLVHTVKEGGEGSSDPVAWQRLVEITAANREVLWIVVVENSRVMASSHHRWLGETLADLPVEVREDVLHVLMKGELARFSQNQDPPMLKLGERVHFQMEGKNELTRGAVVLAVSTRDMGQELAEFRLRLFSFLAVMLTLPLLIVFWLLRRTVLTPVQHLVATMNQRAMGDRHARVRLTSGDELARVATAFNDLLDGLERQESDLRAAKTETERHLIEVEAVGRKYHGLVESTNAIAWEFDLATWLYTYVSPSAERLLGYPVTAWYRPGFWESRLHPEERERVVKSRQIGPMDMNHLEYRMITADDRPLWLEDRLSVIPDEQGKPTLLRGFMVDITDKKAAQEEMWRHFQVEQALAFTSRRFLSIPVDYDTILATLGQALGVNRAYILRRRSDGLLFDNTHEWCQPGTLPHIQDLQGLPLAAFPWFWSHIGGGDGDGNIVVPDVEALPDAAAAEREEFRREGIKALVCVPIGLTSGRVEGMLGVDDTQDTRAWSEHHVTSLRMVAEMTAAHWERKAMEEEKMALQERAMRTAHLASLGMLSASVAHEINNPNNLIAFNTPLLGEVWQSTQPLLQRHMKEHGDFLLAGIPYSELQNDVPRLIRGVEDAARRISGMVAQLKRLVRREAGQPWEQVELTRVVRDALAILHVPLMKKECDLILALDETLPPIWGRVAQLEQVVINVVLNALESLAEQGGRIRVASKLQEQGWVAITITDNGCGIPPELLPRVTEPLFTTRAEQGGTGLGLAICKQIVALHYGTLTLSSTPGQGTEVTMALPVGETTKNRGSHGVAA